MLIDLVCAYMRLLVVVNYVRMLVHVSTYVDLLRMSTAQIELLNC